MEEVEQKTHSYRVGAIEVLPVSDGSRTGAVARELVTNIPYQEVNARLESLGMPKDQFSHSFNPVVLKIAGKTVLVDTGMGVAAASQPGATIGFMTQNLNLIGIKPTDIELVVISHFHADHINGLLAPDGTAAFPNALITVPYGEWQFWMTDDEEMERSPPGRMKELFHNNRRVFGALKERVIIHSDGQEIVSGMTAKLTPGHSIAHTSYLLESAGDRVFLAQDAFNHPYLSVCNPEWRLRFDQIPEMAEETRHRLLKWLTDEQVQVQGYHFPFPGRAFIKKDNNGYRASLIAGDPSK
jgi:glyoxylase-like metal-dependent hydrolase (beta-lactamase superfamily II)